MKQIKNYCIFIFAFLIYNESIAQNRKMGEEYIDSVGQVVYYGKHISYSINDIYTKFINNKKRFSVLDYNSCYGCQFDIRDGDTINFIDKTGSLQGRWVSYRSFNGRNGFPPNYAGDDDLCNSCDFLERNNYYKDNVLQHTTIYGYKKGVRTDTLRYERYVDGLENYVKYRDEVERVVHEFYVNSKGWREGASYKYDLQTGVLLEKAKFINGQRTDSAWYYNLDGILQAISYNDNFNDMIYFTFYRENGIRYARIELKSERLSVKECFKEDGKTIIPCDPKKDLTGKLKTN